MKLNDSAAKDINTDYESNQIIRASELVGMSIIIWAKRKANTQFGEAMFCDYQHAGDDEQHLFTVVFSASSPAFRQLEAVSFEDIREQGLEVVVLEAGRSFKLGDPDDTKPAAKPAPPAPRANPTQRRAAPVTTNDDEADDVPW